MYFSPFDLLDSLAHHGAGDYATGSNEAHACQTDQHDSDRLSVDTYHGVEIPEAHSTHEMNADVSNTPSLFVEHDGHSHHGYEGDTALHEGHEHADLHAIAHVGDEHAINESSHESSDDSEHQTDFVAAFAATGHSHDLGEQGQTLDLILDRHLSEAELV